MKSILHIALRSCPDYLQEEAETLLSRMGEFLPGKDTLDLKLGKKGTFYEVVFQIDSPDEHLSTITRSRYLEDALEDSFTSMIDLLSQPEQEERDLAISGVDDNGIFRQ